MSHPERRLTPENHLKGFLIDEELMGGISPVPGSAAYSVFVIRHTTGELLGSNEAPNLETALSLINSVQRNWIYESASQCGGKSCNEGNCGTGSCKKVLSQLNSGSQSPEACESTGPCLSPDPAQ